MQRHIPDIVLYSVIVYLVIGWLLVEVSVWAGRQSEPPIRPAGMTVLVVLLLLWPLFVIKDLRRRARQVNE